MSELYNNLNFKSRYRFALLAIALLSLAAFFSMRYMLSGNAEYAEIINISGRQRMLSQRISLLYDRIYSDNENAESYRSQLDDAIDLFKTNHQRLIGTNSINNFKISKEMKDFYFKNNGVNDKVSVYLAHLQSNLQQNKYTPFPIESINELLQILNQAVQRFEKESRDLTSRSSNAETLILALTLLLLLIEALYVFKPINKLLKVTIENLVYEKEQAILARQIKSRFVANMTHEIRTPLNGIIGSVQLLAQKEINPDYKEYIDIISSCSKSTLELVNSILDFEKIEANKLELYKEWYPIQKIEQDLSYQFILAARQKNINFEVRNSLTPHTEIFIDGVRLKQVLINLLSNAFKFTDKGSIILSIKEENSNISFEVIDTGRGIEIKDQKLIYESFTQIYEQSKDQIQGTGLGLNICRSLVTIMGGELYLESKPKEGSTFKVILPMEQRINIPSDENIIDHSQSKVIGHHILVLEDNSINSIIIKKYLENLGHQHIIVENGQQGLKMLAEHHFDIILCDIQMPVMNGVEFIKLAQEQNLIKGSKIYAFTANALKEDLDNYKAIGFYGTIQKPVTIFALKKILEE